MRTALVLSLLDVYAHCILVQVYSEYREIYRFKKVGVNGKVLGEIRLALDREPKFLQHLMDRPLDLLLALRFTASLRAFNSPDSHKCHQSHQSWSTIAAKLWLEADFNVRTAYVFRLLNLILHICSIFAEKTFNCKILDQLQLTCINQFHQNIRSQPSISCCDDQYSFLLQK